MGDVRWLLMATVALLTLEAVRCSPRIAGSQYVYELRENGKVCIYASFRMSFEIFYESDKKLLCKEFSVPNNTVVKTDGVCDNSFGNGSNLTLEWGYGNTLQMMFARSKGKWKLSRLSLTFNFSADVNMSEDYDGLQKFSTNGTDLFSRKFKKDEYFYCKNCKTYNFGQYDDMTCEGDCLKPCVNYTNHKNKSKMYCSNAQMKKSVIYIEGDPSHAKKRLCLEDYIELQEIIVPIAVGGVLGLLLVLIFVAYIIAYVRRRRREARSQYEPVGDF